MPPKKSDNPLERIATRKLAASLKRELRQILKEKKGEAAARKTQKGKVLRPSQD
jgi:hypothetical protein